MAIVVRCCEVADDYDVVDRFLVEVYEPVDRLFNWLQPRWEYMHSHPYFENIDLGRIGIAEEHDGTVTGVVHPEHAPAFCYVQARPGHTGVKPQLVDWAEAHLGDWSRTLEQEAFGLYVDDTDTDLQGILADRGYAPSSDWGESHARLRLDTPVPETPLPAGFCMQSLADENDLAKLNRVLWRGYDHDGPPPHHAFMSRARAQRTPNYQKDLNIIVVAPNGTCASYVGIWFVAENRVAYVEPVATDPAYRGMGSAEPSCQKRSEELELWAQPWHGSDRTSSSTEPWGSTSLSTRCSSTATSPDLSRG